MLKEGIFLCNGCGEYWPCSVAKQPGQYTGIEHAKHHPATPKDTQYPGYTRQSILFTYKPPTNTKGSHWQVKASGGATIPSAYKSAPYDYGIPTDTYLLGWGLDLVRALEWRGKWVLASIGSGKYALVGCGDDAPLGLVAGK